jgi:hypothetical protein
MKKQASAKGSPLHFKRSNNNKDQKGEGRRWFRDEEETVRSDRYSEYMAQRERILKRLQELDAEQQSEQMLYPPLNVGTNPARKKNGKKQVFFPPPPFGEPPPYSGSYGIVDNNRLFVL